jgi:hypothetical protein
VVPGCTVLLPPRVCTLRQSVAVGGGVVVLLGVGVGVDVGVGVVLGVLFVPPGATVGLAWCEAETFPVEPGFGVAGLVLGATLPPPGVGSGTGGVAADDGPVPVLGFGGDDEEAAAEAPSVCFADPPAWMVRAAASRRTGSFAAVCAAVACAAVRTSAFLTELAEHAFVFVAWVGEPCTPVSHMLTAPNDTAEAVARPITGVKASRLVIDSLLPPSRESCGVVIAYQPEKAFPDTLTRHLAVTRAGGPEFAVLRVKIHNRDPGRPTMNPKEPQVMDG